MLSGTGIYFLFKRFIKKSFEEAAMLVMYERSIFMHIPKTRNYWPHSPVNIFFIKQIQFVPKCFDFHHNHY